VIGRTSGSHLHIPWEQDDGCEARTAEDLDLGRARLVRMTEALLGLSVCPGCRSELLNVVGTGPSAVVKVAGPIQLEALRAEVRELRSLESHLEALQTVATTTSASVDQPYDSR